MANSTAAFIFFLLPTTGTPGNTRHRNQPSNSHQPINQHQLKKWRVTHLWGLCLRMAHRVSRMSTLFHSKLSKNSSLFLKVDCAKQTPFPWKIRTSLWFRLEHWSSPVVGETSALLKRGTRASLPESAGQGRVRLQRGRAPSPARRGQHAGNGRWRWYVYVSASLLSFPFIRDGS